LHEHQTERLAQLSIADALTRQFFNPMSSAPNNAVPSERVPLWPWAYIVALAYFALHMVTATRYGYFRDALYYLACAEHPAFGYVDQPPLFPLIAWFARHTLGTSLRALIFCAGAWRAPFRRRACGRARRHAGGLVGDRSSVRHECVRSFVLDRMRIRDSAHDQHA
jgi:hypothetical protein